MPFDPCSRAAMPRQRLPTDVRRANLLALPTCELGLIRHHTPAAADLAGLSPLGWEHLDITGDHVREDRPKPGRRPPGRVW